MNKQQFAKSNEFVDAVVSSTQAGFGGSGYSTEFFPDGSHRVLANNQIGNLYKSAGEIVRVPQLSQEEVMEAIDDDLRGVAEFYQDELAEQFLSD